MIRYNWEVIKKHTKNDISKILDYFYKMYSINYTIFLSQNPWAMNIVLESKTSKNQYILNINGLLENSFNATKQEMYVYLDLVSMRDYFSYINTKGEAHYLPTWKIVDKYDIKQLETNRLLFIEENKIYFVYEGDTEDG